MKYKFLFLICICTSSTLANINYIEIGKISTDPGHVELFKFIKDNQEYYSHWTPTWNYNKNKLELEFKLQAVYREFQSLPRNAELSLLLGDIAHYLYNMDAAKYFDSAVNNYRLAATINPQDYRCYWFLGFHFAQANVTSEGIYNLFKAASLTAQAPADFWNEYAWATAIANMPSHSIFAMDKVKELTNKPGNFEEQLGDVIRKRIVSVDRDSTYRKEKIWTATGGSKSTFLSRPLGVKLLLDSTWQVSIYDYAKRMGVFIINPPTLRNKEGREIHYTIALLMKTADEADKLDDYLQLFVSKFRDKRSIKFSKKYDKMIAYEIKDKTMYADIGGGHLYMIGVERAAPKYPGLVLETPFNVPFDVKKKEVSYFTPSDSKNRFQGKIFYAIMLDSCEDIHDGSLSVFKEFFENLMVIE